MKYLEDFQVGQVFEFGAYKVTQEEIIEFATKYDPQYFHVDAEAAKDSIFGGLIASGWHTCSIFMRLLVDHFLNEPGNLGSPGVDQVRWHVPVRPGDTLSVRLTIVDITPSRSKPERGALSYQQEVFNQDGVLVMSMHGIGMHLRRPKG